MASRWLRRDTWSRIQARADAIDSEFGTGGDWYRQLARELVKRARSGQHADEEGFYLNGIYYAANAISAVLLPGNRPGQPDELGFLHRYAGLAHPKEIAVDAARRLLKEQVDAVLPPKKGSAEGVLPGVHVPVHFSHPAARIVYDEPAVIVGSGTYPQSATGQALRLHTGTIVNVDIASRVVRLAESGGWAKGAVGSIEWDPSRANAWVDGLITNRYEAVQVTTRGIDVFDERINPAHAETHAYRFDPRITKVTAQAIGLGYHRYQADLIDGVVDGQSLNRAIDASRIVIGDQPPEVRAGALEMIDVIDLGAGQIPTSAVRAALNAVTEDLFETPSAGSATYLVPGTADYNWLPGPAEGGEPPGRAEDRPAGPDEAGGPPARAEQRVLEVQSTGSLAEREVTVFAAVTPEELLRPSSQASEPFAVELGQPILISSSAEGFITDDQPWVQVQLEPGKRSPTVAFRYRVIRGAGRFAITVTVRQPGQSGAELGRVTLREFGKAAPVKAPLDDDPYSVDVTISVDDNGVIRLFTADGNYRGHALETTLMREEEARVLVDRFVETVLSDADESPDEVEEALLLLALDVKQALPRSLIDYLEQTESRNVLIDYPVKNSFPFELALLESSDSNPRLLGEVHNVTRWPSTAANSPCHRSRKIGRAAFISDPESLAESEAAVESHRTALRQVCPTDDYHDLKTVRESVFRVTAFGLLDFVTHMGNQQGKVGLSIGGKILYPTWFFKPDRQFGSAAALVFVNACSSIRAAAQFYSPKSFPQQFIDFHVPAVVASVLPVEPDLALMFGNYFYAALHAGNPIGNAVRSARKALMADDSAEFGPERRRLAAAAYCVFGHPMMPVKFERGANE